MCRDVKTRIDQLHRDYQAAQHFCYGAVRLNVGPKFIAAKENVVSEERIAFALKIKLLRQPFDLVVMLGHPFCKEGLFTRAFLVAEITGDESSANSQAG